MHILVTNVHLDCGGRVPVTGMLAGMNLSKPGKNLSKPGMNLSKPGKKHNNHVIMVHILYSDTLDAQLLGHVFQDASARTPHLITDLPSAFP